jgi:type II secretion system protein N
MKSSGVKLSYFTVGLLLSAVGLVSFLVSLWLVFPYGDVERRLESELAKRGIEAQVTGLGPRTPLSYSIKNIRLVKAMDKELNLDLKDTVVWLGLGGIFGGKVGLSIESNLYGGQISAEVVVPAPEEVSLGWKGLNLEPLVASFWEDGYPVSGKATGQAKLQLPFESLAKADATADLDVTGLSVGPIRVVGLAFDPISLGDGKIRTAAEKGRIRVFETRFTGGDVALGLDGNISAGASLARSPLEATLDIKPSEKAERDLLIPLTLIASYKNKDGSYTLKLRGTPASPYLQPVSGSN